jgi:death-on-curing protein
VGATYYLDIHDVLGLHRRQLERFGGAPGIRDAGLIEAALARPQSGYYRDLIEEAAALWESLTMNHGFIDGNKRVGFAATHVFLRINGLDITATAHDTFQFVIGALDAGVFEKERLEAWLRTNTVRQQDREGL